MALWVSAFVIYHVFVARIHNASTSLPLKRNNNMGRKNPNKQLKGTGYVPGGVWKVSRSQGVRTVAPVDLRRTTVNKSKKQLLPADDDSTAIFSAQASLTEFNTSGSRVYDALYADSNGANEVHLDSELLQLEGEYVGTQSTTVGKKVC